VIGSPLFEATELKNRGWDVTYLDVRKPPLDIKFVQGDATKMVFADESFDAVSSACVLTHAGLGRYGDAKANRGDELMLREIKRVLKPGCKAAVTFGPVASIEKPVCVANLHRVYTITEALRMISQAGFSLADMKVWGTLEKRWVEIPTDNYKEPDYLSVLLKNVATS
jgi:ubiquinone/menaquinone biosynthesis C-methylase UbiE